MRKLAILTLMTLVLSVLPACSVVQMAYKAATEPVSMDKVLKGALTVEIAFAGALEAANLYADQEKCGPTSPPAPLCADPATVAKAADLATKADVAVKAMDKIVHQNGVSVTVAQAAVTTATEAVAAFKAITGGN